MTTRPLSILSTGMVSPVGLSAPASCAAIRAKLTNPTETRFVDSTDELIAGHSVPLDEPWRGLDKLAQMAAMAIEESLGSVPREDWARIPLLLCVAEPTRPGRPEELDDELFGTVCHILGDAAFAESSALVPRGRVSIGVALLLARKLLYESEASEVLIAATDSMLTFGTMDDFAQRSRLLTPANSNGFMPGEAAASLLVGRPSSAAQVRVEGLGFAVETASIDSETPLRAEGLRGAILAALSDAGRELHDMDYRIVDASGEQYYFKEAALALARTLRARKEEFDIWHPAECIGETGCAIGPCMLAVADAAARKAYAPGPNVLVHAANDAGERAAIVLTSSRG